VFSEEKHLEKLRPLRRPMLCYVFNRLSRNLAKIAALRAYCQSATMRINPYLIFNGNCREAFTFTNKPCRANSKR
jgi:hypothetical protein